MTDLAPPPAQLLRRSLFRRVRFEQLARNEPDVEARLTDHGRDLQAAKKVGRNLSGWLRYLANREAGRAET